MRHNSTSYILGFSTIICVVCSLLVAGSATILKPRQEENAKLDKQKKILILGGVMDEDAKLAPSEILGVYRDRIDVRIVNLATGELAEEGMFNPETYDQGGTLNDPGLSKAAPENPAQVQRIPLYGTAYGVKSESGELELLILPIEGKGLWSTLFGFLALDKDYTTIRGISFYKHGETPGLGGEVDNPTWKAKWPGRRAFGDDGTPAIQVIKGAAGSPDSDPHHVDGLSGSTITSNGVTNLLRFWLGENGFGPYLSKLREQGSAA